MGPKLLQQAVEAVLEACQRRLGRLDLLRPRPGAEHLESRPRLFDLGLGRSKLTPIILVRDPRDPIPLRDPLALRHRGLRDDAVRPRADIGVVARPHRELARDRQLYSPEEEHGQHGGERDQELRGPLRRRDPIAPWLRERGARDQSPEPALEHRREQPRGQDRPDALVSAGEQVSQRPRDRAQEPDRVPASQKAVDEVDPSLARARRLNRSGW